MSRSYRILLLLLPPLAAMSAQSADDARPCLTLVPRDTGVAWTFELSYVARGAFDMARLLAAPPSGAPASTPTRQNISSTLTGMIRVNLASSKRDTVVATLTGDVSATVGSNDSSAAMHDVRSVFAHGFDVVYDSAGAILGFRARAEETPGAVAFARALLGAVQLDVPCAAWNGRAVQWTRREADPNGLYDAHYSIVGGTREPGILAVAKSKGIYITDSSGANATALRVNSSGRFLARLNGNERRLAWMTGTDSQVVTVGNAQLGTSVTRVHLRFRGSSRASREEVAKAARLVPLYVRDVDSSASRRMATRTLGANDLADVEAALRRLDSTNGSAAATTPAFRLTRAFVLLQPNDVDSLASLLRAEEGTSPAFRTLTAALASAGTAAAERALASGLRARIADVAAARRLIAALGSMGNLTASGVLALEDAIDRATDERVSSEAALALGNAAGALSVRNDSLGNAVVRWLMENVAKHPPAERRVALVSALGNSRSREASATLLTALADSDPNVRVVAVQALSTVPDGAIRGRLLRTLRTDTVAFVRLRAAFALDSIGDAALMSAERDALLSEPDVEVRMQLVTNLWAVRDRWPELGTLLRELATTDPAERVKELIARLLAGGAADGMR